MLEDTGVRLVSIRRKNSDSYPVLYLLDGDHVFAMATDFVLYTLFQKPGIFTRMIAIDGTDVWLLDMEEKYSTERSTLPVRLFVGSGSDDMTTLANKMAKRGYSGFTVEHELLNTSGHFTVGAEGLTKGLISVFHS